MRKIGTLILIFVLLLTLFSCSLDNEIKENEDDPDVKVSYDFGGYEFMIRDFVHNGDTPMIPTEGQNELDDFLISRYKQIESDYNCTIQLEVGESLSMIAQSAIGEKYADIMNEKIYGVYNMYSAGLLLDLNQVEGLDLKSGKFGSPNIIKATTWGDASYGMVAAYWGIPTPFFADAFLFNPRILNENSQPSPHELFENKDWSWDQFEKICIAVTDTSDLENPVYGSVLNGYFQRAALFSNGASYAKEDKDGRIVYNLASEEAVDTVNWIKKLNNDYKVLDKPKDWEKDAYSFAAGRFAFLAEYSWIGLSKDGGRVGVAMEEEFGWICFPRGPKGNYDTLAAITNDNFFLVIPIQAEENFVGPFAEELFKPLRNENYGWREDFRREVFWNDESYNQYMAMLDSAVFDYSIFITKANPANALNAAITGKKSPIEVFANIESKAQEQLNSELNDFIIAN
ncbi:MAG: sugar transporter substrate-binding protein [Clostridia bacterium]|nr:sugar transporter substrate-binding protein [Clostridia bacterium]